LKDHQPTTTEPNEPVDSFEADLARLAKLPSVEYERCRKSEAKRLDIRSSVLDELVNIRRATTPNDRKGLFIEVESWHDSVDGAALADMIVAIIERHIACEREVANATALWIIFTWCIEVMHTAPVACITAPLKRCGKTILLRLIGKLCAKPLMTSNISASALFRSIEKWHPTLLIDEADTFLKDNEDIRGILNAGHSTDGYVLRTTGDDHEPTPFYVFGAKAIAGIGHLPDTLKDRSILLELRRKRKDEQRQRLRYADQSQFLEIRQKLARWSGDHMEVLRVARPELPDALNDRAQDNWEPLFAIADCLGSHWSQTARHAALSISGIEEEAPSIKEQFLADIKKCFKAQGVTRIPTVNLLKHLCSDVESPWVEWGFNKTPMTPRQLSKLLGNFGIKSKTMRDGSVTFKGYELTDFQDAFNRYLLPFSDENTILSVTQ
jgi:putative DNA primase/helicase